MMASDAPEQASSPAIDAARASLPRGADEAGSSPPDWRSSSAPTCASSAPTAAGTLGPENGVTVTCTVAETLLPTATAVRLGPIAKELVTNALEHVFFSGRTGVTFTAESGAWHLTVEGSGTGLPAAASSRRVGLRLGRNLSRETGGRLRTTGLVGGTRCSVVGPQPRAER